MPTKSQPQIRLAARSFFAALDKNPAVALGCPQQVASASRSDGISRFSTQYNTALAVGSEWHDDRGFVTSSFTKGLLQLAHNEGQWKRGQEFIVD